MKRAVRSICQVLAVYSVYPEFRLVAEQDNVAFRPRQILRQANRAV